MKSELAANSLELKGAHGVGGGAANDVVLAQGAGQLIALDGEVQGETHIAHVGVQGDLDMLAPARSPIIYRSEIYPFPCIVCNVWRDGTFISRLNILCIHGDTSPLAVRACEIIMVHLNRLVSRTEKLLSDGPLQSMLIDLLHGVRLSEELISERLKANPHMAGSLMQVFYADMEARDDRQIAPYYASLLKRLFPEEAFLPLVFQEQLVLLAYAHYSFSLVETLKVYLECNCNLIRTSERLFLHKNTLLYRLNHIRSIIRCDLNDADERLLLMLSFKLLERM